MMTMTALLGAIELGTIYAIIALGVFISFRTLNMPDLTVDGSIVTGMATSAVLCVMGVNPYIALIGAFAAGACAELQINGRSAGFIGELNKNLVKSSPFFTAFRTIEELISTSSLSQGINKVTISGYNSLLTKCI